MSSVCDNKFGNRNDNPDECHCENINTDRYYLDEEC